MSKHKEEITEPTEASVLDEAPIEETKTESVMETKVEEGSKFQELLNKTMQRRWNITAIVLTTFLFIAVGISLAVHGNTVLDQEWKEILLLMLGAFIGSYGKIIDYWFSDTEKDKMLVQKMDEEDGSSLSSTLGG